MEPRYRFIDCYSRQGRVGVLVEFGHDELRTPESPEFADLSRNIAMHITAVNPQSMPVLLRQYYKRDQDPLFLRRPRYVDDRFTIEAALAEVSTKVGDRITIMRFVRWDTKPPPPSLLEPAVAMRQRRRE